jgi:hypothetical protein
MCDETIQGTTGPVINACRAQTPFRFAYISCRMPSNLLCEAWKAALASPGSCVWSMHREVLKVISRYWRLKAVYFCTSSLGTQSCTVSNERLRQSGTSQS